MAVAIPSAIANWVATAVINGVTAITGPLSAAAFNAVYAAAFYGTQFAIYAGISVRGRS